MNIARKVISTPAIEPVTLEEAQNHLQADDDHQAVISPLIARARKRFEAHTGRLLVQQTWLYTMPKFSQKLVLPNSPVKQINHIKYIDKMGAWVTIEPEKYRLIESSHQCMVTPRAGRFWPFPGFKICDAVQIEAVCGYGQPDQAGTAIDPASLYDQDTFELCKQAILILVADWFRNREDTAPVKLYDTPNAFKALCAELSLETL